MTYNVAPKKGQKVWVCRFKAPDGEMCTDCMQDVITAIEVSGLKPIQSWNDFFAPFFFIDKKCNHDNSPNLDKPSFVSFYLGQKNG